MNKLFDECIKEAIKIGRKYMIYCPENKDEPTKQEWTLALVLLQHRLLSQYH